MAKKEWKYDESLGLMFAGIIPKSEHDCGVYEDNVYEVFDGLVNNAAEDPDAAIGHLTAIVYQMAHTIVKLNQNIGGLRKDLDEHGHENAVVVKY